MSPVLALDLDGTLISCQPRHTTLMGHVCRGDDLPPDTLNRLWAAKREGASNLTALRALGHPAPEPRCQAWLREIEHWPWLGFDRVFPAAASLLASRRFRCVVITARRETLFVRQQLDRLGITAQIDDLIVVPPHAAQGAKAEALRRIQPIGFIGDTESDADAAALAGTPFAAVACGMRSPRFWQVRQPSCHDDVLQAAQTFALDKA